MQDSNYSHLPSQFKRMLDQNTQARINEQAAQKDKLQSNKYSTYATHFSASPFVAGGGAIGLLSGFMTCVDKINTSSGSRIGEALLTWIIAIAVGGALGGILVAIINGASSWSASSQRDSYDQQIAQCDNLSRVIQTFADVKYQNYCVGFEQAAQQESIKYAESKLATDVISWMTDGFARTINAADRRAHVQTINVPFRFTVYFNRITCNLGEYNFELKRCNNLPNGLAQAALSRAIATSIRLNITMQFPKDPSGTAIVTNFSSEYKGDSVETTIVYTAPNGNYKPVRNWV